MSGPGADYFADEERRRRGAYRRDADAEATLREMNRLLAASPAHPHAAQNHPTVLVFGLPRSGTTLLYQVLCYCLDVGYVDNITARFWDAPRFGVALSRVLTGEERDGSFASDYGRTRQLAGPHEFRFFWQRWLGLETMEDHLAFGPHFPKADWKGLERMVADIQASFDRPVVFKSLYFGQFLPALLDAFATPLLVYVERDPGEVALSILAARKAYYGDPSVWWSSFPPDYDALRSLPFDEQIAGQVTSLRRLYEERLMSIVASRVLCVTYRDLIADPTAVVDAVRTKLIEAYGVHLPVLHPPPAAFPAPDHGPVDADGQAVLAALRRTDGGA